MKWSSKINRSYNTIADKGSQPQITNEQDRNSLSKKKLKWNNSNKKRRSKEESSYFNNDLEK